MMLVNLCIFFPDIPEPPTNVTVRPIDINKAAVVWRSPNSLPHDNITHYLISYWKVGVEVIYMNLTFSCNEQHCSEKDSMELNITDLSLATNYYLKVRYKSNATLILLLFDGTKL